MGTEPGPLPGADVQTLDAYWRAANYLSAGQIYLMANALLAEPLRPEHIKPRLLGHWGTSPGLNFIWAHLYRAITAHGTEMMYRHRARPRRARGAGQHLAGRQLLGDLPERAAERGGHAHAVPAVLFPRRGAQPRRAGDARVDPRGRRTRLLAVPRVRRGVRQPGPGRRVRGG